MGGVNPSWITQLADGYEYLLNNDETADRQYLLENLIDDLRKAVKAAEREPV